MSTGPCRLIVSGAVACLVLAFAPVSYAQRGDRPAPPPDRQGQGPRDRGPEDDGPPPRTPEELRERISRRLEVIRGEEARLERALQQLDNGKNTEEVSRSLQERGPRPDGAGPPPGKGPDGAPPAEPIPDEYDPAMAPRIMQFLERRNPELYRRLSEVRDRDPNRFDEMVRERWRRIRDMMAENVDAGPNPGDGARAMRELDRQIRDLAVKAAAAEGDERVRLTGDLRTLVEKQFDVRTDLAHEEISHLQGRVEALTMRLDEATANRDAMIEQRVADLLDGKELPRSDRGGKGDRRGPPDRPSN